MPPAARPAPLRPSHPPPHPLQGGWPDERQAGSRRIECGRCGAAVEVAKFSAQHTSVQWSPAAVRACAEFAARAAEGEPSALIDTCASLRDSISRAVTEGRLAVSPP
jgi:hypothetical protein